MLIRVAWLAFKSALVAVGIVVIISNVGVRGAEKGSISDGQICQDTSVVYPQIGLISTCKPVINKEGKPGCKGGEYYITYSGDLCVNSSIPLEVCSVGTTAVVATKYWYYCNTNCSGPAGPVHAHGYVIPGIYYCTGSTPV
jgi:hypothetical protein